MWAESLLHAGNRRAGLILAAMLCAVLAGCAEPMPPEHVATISRMQGMGGKVMFVEGGYRLSMQNTRITDEDLKDLHKVEKLVSLELQNTQITDEGLKEIAKLKSLAGVMLAGTPTTREGREALRKARPDMMVRQ